MFDDQWLERYKYVSNVLYSDRFLLLRVVEALVAVSNEQEPVVRTLLDFQ